MKRLIYGIVTGQFVGNLMSIIFSSFAPDGEYYPMAPDSFMGSYYYEHFTELQVMYVAFVIWSLIGILFQYADLIFKQRDWSITRMTITHFLTIIIFFFPLAILAGWFPLKFGAIMSFFIIFIIVYFIIWYVQKLYNKKYVDDINHHLKIR
ncbi:DUF3021 domain-containing protein [Macrococcus lamae]|uniref:DUF3021 domain-containing protein n=1 Tax=Macrococcus lamae TaxID=198484 RepID=A0A4R6BTF6_9STAP|nr:DUF3021 domain-containing protein [Macrococcus lamae]TDM07924.1 DUF3021 domain-containing protein [Macrococcus lamae]